jgi:hypothetical protein
MSFPREKPCYEHGKVGKNCDIHRFLLFHLLFPNHTHAYEAAVSVKCAAT